MWAECASNSPRAVGFIAIYLISQCQRCVGYLALLTFAIDKENQKTRGRLPQRTAPSGRATGSTSQAERIIRPDRWLACTSIRPYRSIFSGGDITPPPPRLDFSDAFKFGQKKLMMVSTSNHCGCTNSTCSTIDIERSYEHLITEDSIQHVCSSTY